MKNIQPILNNLLNDECGQDLIEYALIAGVIAVGAIASLGTLANQISGQFNVIGDSL